MTDYSILLNYKERILEGAKITFELSVLGLILAFILGLLICSAKMSKNRCYRIFGTAYTTVLRGIPDLVQLFLFFYGLQRLLFLIKKSDFGKAINFNITLDNFTIASITIGLMFSAYMAETFRGAFLAIPKGQIEAAKAYGFSKFQSLIRIKMPLMLRYALPGISNNWLVLMKTTALVSLVQIDDLTKIIKDAATGNNIIKSDFALRMSMYLIGALGYLIFTTLSLMIFWALKKHFSKGFKEIGLSN